MQTADLIANSVGREGKTSISLKKRLNQVEYLYGVVKHQYMKQYHRKDGWHRFTLRKIFE